MAQGIGNTLCGFFGSFAGCAMIGQSIINFTSGGRGRISNLVGAVLLILFVVSLSDYIALLPVAALAGIMFVVCINTFEWSSLRRLKRMPKPDAVIMIAVTLVTIYTDLAMAVICGVIISALVFAATCTHHHSGAGDAGRHENHPAGRSTFLWFCRQFSGAVYARKRSAKRNHRLRAHPRYGFQRR